MSGRADRPVPYGPYETEQQVRADVAYIHEQTWRSVRPGALAEANLARLTDVCERRVRSCPRGTGGAVLAVRWWPCGVRRGGV
jgi:hypothetical protein